MLSIIIVNYRSSHEISDCLASIVKHEPGYRAYEIIIVDNNSDDPGLGDLKRKYPFIKLIMAPENGGFAYGNNIGIREARGDVIFFLNPDTYIHDNSIEKLLERLNGDPDLHMAGPKLLGPDGSNDSYYSPKSYPTFWKIFCERYYFHRIFRKVKCLNSYYRTYMNYDRESPVESIGGAALMFKRSVIEAIGLLDEKYFMYFEENDFCCQAVKKGFKLLYFPASEIVHIGGATTESISEWSIMTYIKSLKYYFRKNFPHQFYFVMPVFFTGSLLRFIIFSLKGKNRQYLFEMKHMIKT